MSGRFQVVYPDNPWRYRDRGIRGGTNHHYPTLTVEKLCGMRTMIDALAADDCALFLWATWPMLREAFTVIDAWGFAYKTCAFTWCKTTKAGTPAMGLGHWSRGNTEPCLLATRGKPVRVDKGVPQVILDETLNEETLYAPRGEHSAKPSEARDRIVRLLGDVPRVELFARERTPGWHAWGNELP